MVNKTTSGAEKLATGQGGGAGDREIARLAGLTDRFLGQYVLDLARQMRRENPDLFGPGDRKDDSASWLAWEIIPEIARRLGVRDFVKNEGRDVGLSSVGPERLAGILAETLRGSAGRQAAPDAHPGVAWRFASRPASEGNPVIMAADRVVLMAMGETHERATPPARNVVAATFPGPGAGRPVGRAPAGREEGAGITRLMPRQRDPEDPIHTLAEVMDQRRAREALIARHFGGDGGDGLLDLPI